MITSIKKAMLSHTFIIVRTRILVNKNGLNHGFSGGKSVTCRLFIVGMADLALETEDPQLTEAREKLYSNITYKSCISREELARSASKSKIVLIRSKLLALHQDIFEYNKDIAVRAELRAACAF